jgi:hypothetical protein
VVANSVGEAVFLSLRPGEYTIHIASDGDLPDDPKVQVHAKGCHEVSLFRTFRITGRVITRGGVPASRIQVQFRSTDNKFGDGSSMMTDADGHYELRILRPAYRATLTLTAAPDPIKQAWNCPK